MSKIKSYFPLFFILLFFLFFVMQGLGKDMLWDWDECVYAQSAKEMHATRNFLTNQWNGSLVFEKPPLNTILMQVPLAFGVNEFTTRFLFALEGFLLIIAVYFFTKKYFSHTTAILAILLVLTSELIVIYSLHVNTDIGFTLFIFLGVFAWINAYKNPRFSYISGVFFGLAVLNKGLSIAPFLLAISLSIFLSYTKQHLKSFLKFFFTFVAVIFPWHLYHLIIYGHRFFDVYFLEHILKRAASPLDFHFEGRTYYIKLISRELFPWILFIFVLPLIYLQKITQYFSKKTLLKELKNSRIIFTLGLLVIIPLISITLVKTRIAWYAMPIYPFLVILLAHSIVIVSTKLKNPLIFPLVAILLMFDATKLTTTETRFFNGASGISLNNQVVIQSRNYSESTLRYLVPFGERRAKEILAPNLQTSTTFTYGGKPCAVYYSNKKVEYYYSVDTFRTSLGKSNALYMIENGDGYLTQESPVKILFRNSDYTLFRVKNPKK